MSTTLRRGVTTPGANDTGMATKPASGATITLFDSGDTKAIYKRVAFTAYSSHISATDGVLFEALMDGTWRTIVAYTLAATTVETRTVAVWPYPRWRLTFTNSANTLTTWECVLVGDRDERAE